MLESETTQNGHSPQQYVNWGEEASTTTLRQALLTQSRLITELQREVVKLRMIKELLDN